MNKLKTRRIAIFSLLPVAVLAYLWVVVSGAMTVSAQNVTNLLPEPAEFSSSSGGSTPYLVVSKSGTDVDQDALETWIMAYFESSDVQSNFSDSGSSPVTIKDADHCANSVDSFGFINTKFEVVRTNGSENRDMSSGSEDVLATYNAAENSSSECKDHVFNIQPAWLTKSTVPGHVDESGNRQVYTVLIKASYSGTKNNGYNGFKVSSEEGKLGLSAENNSAFLGGDFGIANTSVQDLQGDSSSISEFNFEFAPACNSAGNVPVYYKWLDDDQGLPEQNGNSLSLRIYKINRATLEETLISIDPQGTNTSPIGPTTAYTPPDRSSDGEFDQVKFIIEKGFYYRINWRNVAQGNGMQMWMPFDQFYADQPCPQNPFLKVNNYSCSAIMGWAADPDDWGESVDIHIIVDGETVDSMAADIADSDASDYFQNEYGASEGYNKYKFEFLLEEGTPLYEALVVDGEDHLIQIHAINHITIGEIPFTPSVSTYQIKLLHSCGNDPVLNSEILSCEEFQGYAFDPDDWYSSVDISIQVDGDVVESITANNSRTDVLDLINDTYDGSVDSDEYGYYLEIVESPELTAAMWDGNTHIISIHAINNIGPPFIPNTSVSISEEVLACDRAQYELKPLVYSDPETGDIDSVDKEIVYPGNEVTIIGNVENIRNGTSEDYTRIIRPDDDAVAQDAVSVASVSDGGSSNEDLEAIWTDQPGIDAGQTDTGTNVVYRFTENIEDGSTVCFNSYVQPVLGYSAPSITIEDNTLLASESARCFETRGLRYNYFPTVTIDSSYSTSQHYQDAINRINILEFEILRGTDFGVVATITNQEDGSYESAANPYWVRIYESSERPLNVLNNILEPLRNLSIPSSVDEIGADYLEQAGGGLKLTQAWLDSDGVTPGETQQWVARYEIPIDVDLQRGAFCFMSDVQEARGIVGQNPSIFTRKSPNSDCASIPGYYDLHLYGGSTNASPGETVTFIIENEGDGPSANYPAGAGSLNPLLHTNYELLGPINTGPIFLGSIAGSIPTGEETIYQNRYTGSFTIPSNTPIGQFCVDIKYGPVSGTTYSNDGSDVDDPARYYEQETLCYNIHESPYFTATGGDVQAGGVFADGAPDNPLFCSSRPTVDNPPTATFGQIVSVFSEGSNIGANTSTAAVGLSSISGFGSWGINGLLRSENPSENNQLTFANVDEDRLGHFEQQAHCLPDLFSIYEPASGGNISSLSDIPPDSGTYIYKTDNPNLFSSQLVIPSGKKIILLYDPPSGDNSPLIIQNNIIFAEDYEAANPQEVPFFMLIAKNHDVGTLGSVDQLDGIYVTEQTFSTCSNREFDGDRVLQYVGDNCANQLVVNGQILAGDLELRRTHGGLVKPVGGEFQPAEKISTTPESYLGSFESLVLFLKNPRVDHGLELPPTITSP